MKREGRASHPRTAEERRKRLRITSHNQPRNAIDEVDTINFGEFSNRVTSHLDRVDRVERGTHPGYREGELTTLSFRSRTC